MITNPRNTTSHVEWPRKQAAGFIACFLLITLRFLSPLLSSFSSHFPSSLFHWNFWGKITKMGGQDSSGPSWADQWDCTQQDDQSSPLNSSTNNKSSNGSTNKSEKSFTKKYSKRFNQSFSKTKEAASNGMDKSKESVRAGMKKINRGASWFNRLFHSNSSHTKI